MPKRTVLLGLILCIAAFFRLYGLGEIPNGLYQDETAIGYNAYSLLQTGKDEHGKSYPLYFASFGDQKLPVYIYSTTLSVALFGLTAFAVRLPSALFGILTVLLMYVLVRDLTQKKTTGIIATAILAVNPWHIHYSRATFEVSIGLFLLMAGSWTMLKAFHRKRGWLLLSALCFVAALYTYNLTRLLAPLLGLFTFLYFRRYAKMPPKRELTITVAAAVLALLPFFVSVWTAGGVHSAQGTLLTSSAVVQAPLIEFRSYANSLPKPIPQLFFNSYVLNAAQYARNIASYISVPFFFISGSTHGNHGIATIGQFYLFELGVMAIGILAWLKMRATWMLYLSGWGAVVVGVAALTREAPHATRSYFLLFPLIVCLTSGYEMIAQFVRKKSYPVRTAAICIAVTIGLYSGFHYWMSYTLRFPVVYAPSWRAADHELADFVRLSPTHYDRIIIDPATGIPYTSVLFYFRVPPQEFLTTVKRDAPDEEGFIPVKTFTRFEFRAIDWTMDLMQPRTLVVTTPNNKPENVAPLHAVYYPKKPVVFAVKQTIVQYPVEEIAFVLVQSRP